MSKCLSQNWSILDKLPGNCINLLLILFYSLSLSSGFGVVSAISLVFIFLVTFGWDLKMLFIFIKNKCLPLLIFILCVSSLFHCFLLLLFVICIFHLNSFSFILSFSVSWGNSLTHCFKPCYFLTEAFKSLHFLLIPALAIPINFNVVFSLSFSSKLS